MDVNSNSEASFDLDPDVEVISSTSALNTPPIKVGKSSESGSMPSRKKDAVDLWADEQERKNGLFKHFTAISWDEHLEELRKTSVSDRERCIEIREKAKYEQLVLEEKRSERKKERNRERKRAQRVREKAAVGLLLPHWTAIDICGRNL
jgi:hypothetical protein